MTGSADYEAPADQVEAVARGLHNHQEYSTCWDDADEGTPSRMGTPRRPLGEHGREFYRGLATAALLALHEHNAPIPPAVPPVSAGDEAAEVLSEAERSQLWDAIERAYLDPTTYSRESEDAIEAAVEHILTSRLAARDATHAEEVERLTVTLAAANAAADRRMDQSIEWMERAESARAERDDLRIELAGVTDLLAQTQTHVAALRAKVARVEALADEWEADQGRAWIGSMGFDLRTALASPPAVQRED